jgi:hypothetical protein
MYDVRLTYIPTSETETANRTLQTGLLTVLAVVIQLIFKIQLLYCKTWTLNCEKVGKIYSNNFSDMNDGYLPVLIILIN